MILALITAVLLPREQTDVSGRSLLPQYDFSSSFPTLHFSLLQTWFSAPTRWMWTSLSWLIPCLSGLPAPAGWLSSSLSPLHTIWWSMAMRSASGHETLQRLIYTTEPWTAIASTPSVNTGLWPKQNMRSTGWLVAANRLTLGMLNN